MKKKRLHLITIIALLAALFGSGGGVAWGQAYKSGYVASKNKVELRRGDANALNSIGYIVDKTNVNNEFGAGESSSISQSGSSSIITWPDNPRNLHNPPLSIQLGSEYSRNIVINTYNGDAYAAGFIQFHLGGVQDQRERSVRPSRFTNWIDYTHGSGIYDWAFTNCGHDLDQDGASTPAVCGSTQTKTSDINLPMHPSISYGNVNMGAAQGVYFAHATTTNVELQSYRTHVVDVFLMNHVPSDDHPNGGATGGHWRTVATSGKLPYTSTRVVDKDNGVNLLQKSGARADNPSANVGNAPGHGATITQYIRPTSVSIEGTNTFSQIQFKTIEWWFRWHELKNAPNSSTWFNLGNVSGNIYSQIAQGCWCHNSITYQTSTIDGGWNMGDVSGDTKVDAAVQLLANAKVCVEGSVTDATNNITNNSQGDTQYHETNAVIVVPHSSRFTLRTKGDFKANMVHLSKDSAENKHAFYVADKFPSANNDNILLKSTASENETWANNADMHEYTVLTVPFHNNSNYKTTTKTVKPYTTTHGSVFGVFGDYQFEGKMADIHTDSTTSYNNHNQGVIEVGPTTAHKERFHIYGKGMLKNYEGCNGPGDNFTMTFGTTAVDNVPKLKINTDDTLYIVNFGNNSANPSPCLANLHFMSTNSVDSIGEAFTSAGAGALQIQALNSVRFLADATEAKTWTTSGKKGNNIYVLSDAGNISTQKLYIKSDNSGTEPGHGLINFLAAGDAAHVGACPAGTRNSGIGSIYFNDEVKITRDDDKSTQTNIIAQNNIRTAQFTSANKNEDTTNVISRMGDVYLGYSIPTSSASADANDFTYDASQSSKDGQLNIMAGWDDIKPTMTNAEGMEGGNVYFSRIITDLKDAQKHNTTIAIPYSSEYICNVREDLYKRAGESMVKYEHSGIIGGLGRCGMETSNGFTEYAGKLEAAGAGAVGNLALAVNKRSLKYTGNEGNLIVDAGKRGNIILNKGAQIEFQDKTGNATFRTREGDIDMRDVFDAQRMKGSLLFLAQLENLSDLGKIGVCGCDEMRNNVYLQDFEYMGSGNSGSVFIGADNNIKLNYGGLTNIGTRQDPFLSTDYEEKDGYILKKGRGYKGKNNGCDTYYHCDLDGSENKARDLILNFREGGNPTAPITSGGFAAVASDMIDVYKDLKYYGGKGSGLSAVPGTGTLHGENVAGYGLFMKTQGNKGNWTDNILLQAPKCPTTCLATGCDNVKAGQKPRAFLHNTVRMTFHGDARFYAENQRVHLESPVIETFGVLELNAKDNAGSNAMITIKTDSLICHDSLIRKGTGKVQFSTWSGLPKDLPIIKLGYSRKSAPFAEYSYDDGNTRKLCRECVDHYKGKVYGPGETPLDTIFVKFGPDTEWERQNVMVIDHTVITFLTDSFDHVKGGGVLNARYFVDTTKIRNQVEFWTDKNHERDGHLELISERQMGSKDYAGLYTKHLHLEPIGACGHPTSEMWLPGLALDVITTSTFGGFGIQYTDVHVENGANLNPGFTSLRLRGQCYEQACGTLTMKDLRLDGGAELHFSVGTTRGLNGEFSDAIDVDKLTTYGPVNVNIEIRPCEEIEKRCYPIIYYKSVSPNSLNTLKLHPATVKIDGEEYPLSLNLGTDGVVYLCVGDAQVMDHHARTVTIPTVAGVKTIPGPGIWEVKSRSSFPFRAVYTGKPLVVRTNRMVNGVQEVLGGVKNANGEYEYIIPHVQQEITLTFGPDVVSNEFLAGAAVWSHGEMIYIRVERADIASIYSVAGQLVKRVDLPEGDTSIPMSRGAYVITLKDGSVHKVIVK